MRFKLFSLPAFLAVLIFSPLQGATGDHAEKITIDRDLQIPGNVLKPGVYMFSMEDSLTDRAIIKISSADGGANFLLLAVPNGQLVSKTAKGLVLFAGSDPAKRILHGWSCPGCSVPLEFAYPKLEAVAITGETGESVLAVDPESDKLPANLSPDDMKVVTLWLLSPKRIEAGHHGVCVNAAKYADVAVRRRHLPQTASNTYWLALCGVLSLALSGAVRARSRRIAS